ncbi:alpha-N-acetylglucosaminidase [Streptomyces sp. So13.3]|uniref:alpha-N-acetylglucosaminidase n=1 Tax=unclassified Streptomyces TaxID=2593676 RepID=UPI001105DC4B|nr:MULTISPECIES: alpha-N-acetylglucosaminidase [unclassified Streptomyces]MCZ4099403.1 alpha-N-acetylglucosaminidase C-terminal domain-containing protein [Streptomyces sp. H39-C1]QNA70877.1 alpha-N-acetylglucosaminidase [Streptomyces sp. So13.3]
MRWKSSARATLSSIVLLTASMYGDPTAHANPNPPSVSAAFDPAPASAALSRLLPARAAAQFSLVPVPKPASGDAFTLSGSVGAITVAGTSPATLLTGVGWYLEHVAGVDIGWPGDSLGKLPAALPAVPDPVTRSATVPHRYALNDTDDGYSGAYRDFASYQHEIDVLALHGVNEVFVQMGAEYPYYKALQSFGYSGAELRSWIPGPAHQGWWLLQNMSGFGGPVSEQLINARAAEGRQITDQLRALGMTPVLPGYYGTVPPGFTDRNPGAKVVAQGDWVGFQRPDWLDPTNAVFTRVAAAYYAAQRTRFGDSTLYKMDLLHEGGLPGSVNVTDAATAVQHALDTAHPGATWVILGWQNNPSAAVLKGVDKARMLIVDGLSDRYDNLDRETAWGGTPYAFGAIDNFGGHTSIGANTSTWVSRFQQWLSKKNSALQGIAYLPEGTGGNPASFDLFTELAWQPGPIDRTAWFADYSARRYGGADAHAAAAWELLRRGPYSTASGTWSEPQDSLFTARPGRTASHAAEWSPDGMRYDAATVQNALAELLQVAPDKQASTAYRYDLVDVARQALANRSRVLLPQINAAYTAKNLTQFRGLVTEWKGDEALLDQLVSSDPAFLLGTWLTSARASGATAAEKSQLEYDARSILTTWGDRAASEAGVHDYASREWGGLISDLYAKRWAAYFASLDTALTGGTAPVAIDWFAMDDSWARQTNSYSTSPSGDPIALAQHVRDALPPIAPSGPITGIGGACVDITGGSTADGTPLQLYGCNGTTAQRWTVSADGTLRANGKCMDVRGGAVTPGTVVQLYTCNGTPAQAWTPRSDGTLRNTKSGLCLDAGGGSSANGTALIIWTCTGNVNQRWSLPS